MFDYKIEHLSETESTNSLLLERAQKGDPDGSVIWADHQSAGRGKPGNHWHAQKEKDLLFSILLRPPVAVNQAPLLTQIACHSVQSVLKKECAIEAMIKRPNDLLVRSKKICGILTESSTTASGQLQYVVVGIGLNVNSATDDLIDIATSIFLETKKEWDRRTLLDRILETFKFDLKGFYARSA
jgi:BirA family biotin operon repressor/biotin-[acetyl-CoA-carboxylase] ligase